MKKNYSFGKILFLIFVFLHANVFAMDKLKVSDGPLPGPYKDFTSAFPSIVVTPPESSGSSSSSSSSSSYNVLTVKESDSQIFAKKLGYCSGDLSLGGSIALAQEFVDLIEKQQQLEKELITQFNKAFIWAAQKGWVEVIKVFLKSEKMIFQMTKEFVRGLFSDLTLKGHFEVVNELLNNKTFLGKFLSLSEGPEDQEKFAQSLNSLLSTIFVQNYTWVKIFLRSPSILVLMDQEILSQAINMTVAANDQETLSFVPKELLHKQGYKKSSQPHRDNCNLQ